MQAKRGATKIPVTQVSATLDGAVQGADQARAAGLTGLQKIRLARAKGMERERDRLSARYGAADPRVGELARAMEADQALVRRLSLEVTRANTSAPQPDPAAWIVFGYVLDANAAGVANVRVVPCDSDGADIAGTSGATTEKAGYFAIKMALATAAAGTESGRTVPGGTDQGQPDPGKTGSRTPAGGGPPSEVFLRVDDAQGRILVRDSRPLTPAAGKVDYREVVLGDGGATGPAPQAPPAPPATATPVTRVPTPRSRRKSKAKPSSSA